MERESCGPSVSSNHHGDHLCQDNGEIDNDRHEKGHCPQDLVVLEEAAFRSQMETAVRTCTPLDLTGRHVTLTSRAVRLKSHQHLEIVGGTIAGDEVHSLFQLDGTSQLNPRRLTLRRVTLIHTKQDEDPRHIGAAVFAMGTSVVVLDGCSVSSRGGFAVWAKHDAHVRVTRCALHDVGRTAVACFNQASAAVRNSTLERVGMHGVCARGTSRVTLQNVLLDRCRVRAVMVYQGATVTMEDCTIRNTSDPTTPTVHALGPPLETHADHDDKHEESISTTNNDDDGGSTNGGTTKNRTKKKRANKTPNHIKVPKPDPTLLVPTLIMHRCQLEANNQGTLIELEGRVHHNIPIDDDDNDDDDDNSAMA